MEWPSASDAAHLELLPLDQWGEECLLISQLRVRIVGSFDIGSEKTRKNNPPSRHTEGQDFVFSLDLDFHRRALETSRHHLTSHRALPDHLVETVLVCIQVLLDVLGAAW